MSISRSYDHQNVFAKILREELPRREIYQDEFCLAFYTINPVAKIHAVVIPKGNYIDYCDFVSGAKNEDIVGFFKGVERVATILSINSGCKINSNCGVAAGQEVMHFHVHLIAN